MPIEPGTRGAADPHPAANFQSEQSGEQIAAAASRRYHAVLDLQGCQTKDSRGRGIGRYSRSLAEALVTSAGDFDFTVCFNNAFVDSAKELTQDFEAFVGDRRIVRYDALCPSTPWSATVVDAGRVAGEWIAQYAWIDLVALPPSWQSKCRPNIDTWSQEEMIGKCLEWGKNEHDNVREYLYRSLESQCRFPRDDKRIGALRARLAREFGR